MLLDYPHRRFNQLTREWVLVSPHRAKRPWLGQVEKTPPENLPTYDPTCYLCPGNSRAGGAQNPAYTSTFVFDNDFAALLPDTQSEVRATQSDSLFVTEPEPGLCRVVCFSPRHDLTLPELSQAEVEDVIRMWTDQTRDLGQREFINYVQVFENKGAMMGCSNPHPHSQIWAVNHLPNEPQKEYNAQQRYWLNQNACLVCDYLAEEHRQRERIVAQNEDFTALVPFWAVWPFEIMVIANHHCGSLTDLNQMEQTSLADMLRRMTARYDNLFEISFPYSMGFHQAPTDGHPHDEWHFHAHFYPPLLRSATVKKFMVGYEMLAEAQRDLTPEQAAERLRGLSDVHYKTSVRG
ncbi:MAG TPA: UDP-glucose--hexose-1-phosphate uridylyltransferase [Anaerolineae bacterium]|nr:UDP-glucose--hexose-1-phosphate uridylyltransferase [Anaerolineae bacterium]